MPAVPGGLLVEVVEKGVVSCDLTASNENDFSREVGDIGCRIVLGHLEGFICGAGKRAEL
jgi:hypothetical protein